MPTLTIAGRIDTQIEQMAELEELASQIQSDDEASALPTAARLKDHYQRWYAAAHLLLPDDLKERFRFEYEGDLFRYRIKHFIGNPREQSALYASLDNEGLKTLNPNPWQYPFNSVFQGPFASQKLILLE